MDRDISRRDLLRVSGGVGLIGVLGYATGVDDVLLGNGCGRRISPEWEFRPGGPPAMSPPTVVDGSLFYTPAFTVTALEDGSYFARVDIESRTERWRFESDREGFGLPRVAADRVFVGTGTDDVCALDSASGTEQWRYRVDGNEEYGGGAWGRPAVVGNRVVAGISHSRLSDPDSMDPSDFTHRTVGLDRETGRETWAIETARSISAGPETVGSDVVVGTEGGRLYRLSAADGTERWRTSLPAPVNESPTVAVDRVLVVAGNRVYGIDLDSGSVRWATATRGETPGPTEAPLRDGDGFVTTGVAVEDGLAIVGTAAGTVLGVDGSSGTRRWRAPIESGARIDAIEADGKVGFAATNTGRIAVVDVRDGTVQTRPYFVEKTAKNRCGLYSGYVRKLDVTREDVYVSHDYALYRILRSRLL